MLFMEGVVFLYLLEEDGNTENGSVQLSVVISHLHQIYSILCIPLKKVRRKVSIWRTGLPISTGIPTDHSETLFVQRLQLWTKICLCAPYGKKGRSVVHKILKLILRLVGLYLPRAPGRRRTACFPCPVCS